jgi:hypothetical protein
VKIIRLEEEYICASDEDGGNGENIVRGRGYLIASSM